MHFALIIDFFGYSCENGVINLSKLFQIIYRQSIDAIEVFNQFQAQGASYSPILVEVEKTSITNGMSTMYQNSW